MASDMENLPILIAISVGGEIINIAVRSFEKLRALFNPNDANDAAILAQLDAAYASRIARARDAALGK